MPSDNQEQFERALARHLRNASPDSECPDAETLAAYHERTLSLEELAQWKEHIAGCARCQEILILVGQSEDVRVEERKLQNVPVLVDKAAAHPRWRWILPVGALAAGVIVWVGVREVQTQHSRPAETFQLAQNRPAVPAVPAPSSEAKDQLSSGKPSTPALREENRSRDETAVSSPRAAFSQKAAPATTASAPMLTEGDRAIAKLDRLESSNAERGVPSQPVPPMPSSAARSEALQVAAPPPAIPTASGGAAGANLSARTMKKAEVPSASQSVTVESAAAPMASTANSVSSSREVEVAGGSVASLLQLASSDHRYIIAPGEKQAWRVGESGKIEHSTDRGRTWKAQKSRVTADLTAGSATSDKVCWVAGNGGTLLLTTDGGKHWTSISSPIQEDLGGIHATDALRATIWDISNRKSFETTDGGATWTPIPKK